MQLELRLIAMTKTYNILFLALPQEDIDELSLQNRLKDIGKTANQGSTVG